MLVRERPQVQALPPQDRGPRAAGRGLADAAGTRPTIGRPSYAETGDVVPWDEPRIKSPDVIERMRHAGSVAAEILRLAGEAVRPGVTTDEIDAYCPRPLRRARRVSQPAELPRVPEEPVHVGQRGHLPRHPRLAGAARRRHRQPRRHGVHRGCARRHQRDVLRRRRRPGQPRASPRSPRSACGTASRRWCPAVR